jgi:beta-lactamase regulating signal transducer with metallopeptidase domain
LGVYFGILLLAMPVLRKVMRAESCATLWEIGPSIMLLSLFAHFFVPPLWVIRLPISVPGDMVIQVLHGIWFAGFAGVMIWSIVSHLVFRRRLLKNAKPIRDEGILEIYHEQKRIINFIDDRIRLCVSPDLKSPLSVGLFRSSTCLILPDRHYTPEELELVFHHELVHICRQDSFHKLSMRIYTAVLWFNPLMWLSTRVCAEDIELSCDEAVVYGEPEGVRKQYAHLLLETAADSRGFTTCLSSSAKSLRYRLKNVVKPGKKIIGGIAVGVLCFALMACTLFTGFRFRPAEAKELIFKQEDMQAFEVRQVTCITDGKQYSCEGSRKSEQLLEYLGSLSLGITTGRYELYEEPDLCHIVVAAPEESYSITFGERYLQVTHYIFLEDGGRRSTESFYELDTAPDWDFILSCMWGSKGIKCRPV